MIQCAFPSSKHLKDLELLKHAQLASRCAGWHSTTLVLDETTNHLLTVFVQHTCPEFPSILPNRVHFRYIQQHPRGLRAHWSAYVLSDTLAITAQTKVTRGRLSLIRIEYHKEQICSLSCWTWLVWAICMAPRVPTAGLCPRILFRIVTRSLGCFCRAMGCCVRRLTTRAISAFIFPCPKLLYAWDSFWLFPLATHCTACTQDRWSCNPHQAAPQKAIQGSMRNMQGTMRICWLFGLPSMSVFEVHSATLIWSY